VAGPPRLVLDARSAAPPAPKCSAIVLDPVGEESVTSPAARAYPAPPGQRDRLAGLEVVGATALLRGNLT
jgi:hypothetical protein